jgi:hypothetical protein
MEWVPKSLNDRLVSAEAACGAAACPGHRCPARQGFPASSFTVALVRVRRGRAAAPPRCIRLETIYIAGAKSWTEPWDDGPPLIFQARRFTWTSRGIPTAGECK